MERVHHEPCLHDLPHRRPDTKQKSIFWHLASKTEARQSCLVAVTTYVKDDEPFSPLVEYPVRIFALSELSLDVSPLRMGVLEYNIRSRLRSG